MKSYDVWLYCYRTKLNQQAGSAARYRDSLEDREVKRNRSRMKFQRPIKIIPEFFLNKPCLPPLLVITKTVHILFKATMRKFYERKCEPQKVIAVIPVKSKYKPRK